MVEYEGVLITWLGHDGFKLKKEKVVYVDPYQLKSKAEPAWRVFRPWYPNLLYAVVSLAGMICTS